MQTTVCRTASLVGDNHVCGGGRTQGAGTGEACRRRAAHRGLDQGSAGCAGEDGRTGGDGRSREASAPPPQDTTEIQSKELDVIYCSSMVFLFSKTTEPKLEDLVDSLV